MKIAEVKMDKRGRITLPKAYMKVNGFKEQSTIVVKSSNKPKHILLEFTNKDYKSVS
jgi:bifunctional DNA-binding transcriptional regulator/antitoxin component of YhaV-PrlF toxin-antitoxin module